MTLKVLKDKPDILIIKSNYHLFELLDGISCRLYVLCLFAWDKGSWAVGFACR